MRYLGIDYGERKLGLAISDGILAEPYNRKLPPSFCNAELRRAGKTQSQKLAFIKDIIIREKIEQVVLGLPENKIGKKVKEFGEMLKRLTGLPVEYFDETLTSQEAVTKMVEAGRGEKYRQEKQHNIAACLILQNYLDNH